MSVGGMAMLRSFFFFLLSCGLALTIMCSYSRWSSVQAQRTRGWNGKGGKRRSPHQARQALDHVVVRVASAGSEEHVETAATAHSSPHLPSPSPSSIFITHCVRTTTCGDEGCLPVHRHAICRKSHARPPGTSPP